MRDADVYTDDDMAAVGRALMTAIDRETTDRNGPLFGWHPADCPSEVVGDLVEMLLQVYTITDDMVETACAAYTTEYCGGEAEWPDGWNPARADDHRAAIRASLAALHRLAEQSAPSPATDDLREAVAKAFEECEIGFSLQLVRLVDGVSTYLLSTTDGEPDAEFEDQEGAYAELGRRKAKARSDAALSAIQRDNVILPRDPTEMMVRDVACALARGAGIADPFAFEPIVRGDGAPYWMAWEYEARVALRAALAAKETSK